jgi:hypothetical protein
MRRPVIIGTWESRADWEHFHNSPQSQAIRQKLRGLNEPGREPQWFEVVEMQAPRGSAAVQDITRATSASWPSTGIRPGVPGR